MMQYMTHGHDHVKNMYEENKLNSLYMGFEKLQPFVDDIKREKQKLLGHLKTEMEYEQADTQEA